MSIDNSGSSSELLANGGGNATALGIQFQASVGAILLSKLLTQTTIDTELGLGGATIRWIRFETESPLDDILVSTNQDGYLAFQVKTFLSISTSVDSAFYKTVEQIVRHWLICDLGAANLGWNRPLDVNLDRLVIAISPKSSSAVRHDLAVALDRTREPSTTVPLTQQQQRAIDSFRANIISCWSRLTSITLSDAIIEAICRLTTVAILDTNGGHWAAAVAALENSIVIRTRATSVMSQLRDIATDLMARRSGVSNTDLRQRLLDLGVSLRAPTEYQDDIGNLKAYGATVHSSLTQYQKVDVSDNSTLSIRRSSRADILHAAEQGSLLIIGEPGAGKSAAINDLATDLADNYHDVVQLAVDNLRVDTLEGLNAHLGIRHSFLDVLENWQGSENGYILIDALDASRGGISESIFRSLIEQIVNRDWRWKVIATIRSFDLRLGVKFKALFKGNPPIPSLADPTFPGVRHIQVPRWGAEELEFLATNAPNLAGVIQNLPPRLKELAAVPFNVRLIAELIASGTTTDLFRSVHSEVELLHLYWEQRIGNSYSSLVCLKHILRMMIERYELRAEKVRVLEHCQPSDLEFLTTQGVLIENDNGRFIHFRHHLLFDYAVSRAFLSVTDLLSGSVIFDKQQTQGMMLAPALRLTLSELWLSNDDRKDFWIAIVNILKFDDSDPVMKSVASRLSAELTKTSKDVEALLNHARSDNTGTFTALNHIIGALAVRADDREQIHSAAWSWFAAGIANLGINLNSVWPIRSLLYILYERVVDDTERKHIGAAGRLLLEFGFSNKDHRLIADSGIRFVTQTFDTDVVASRKLLGRVFEKTRFDEFAHEDLPTLSYNVGKVVPFDPDFGVEIYKAVYGRDIEVNRETTMSNSQILPLLTNAKQDYAMARYSLKEYFPKFLAENTVPAIMAMIYAAEGFIQRKHALENPEIYGTSVDGLIYEVVQDYSYIWAANPFGRYPEDAEELVIAFTNYFLNCDEDVAREVANTLLEQNSTAWLWARLFMVAARREFLAPAMWEFATSEPFLRCTDTLKDAVDVINANYLSISEVNKSRFERSLLSFDFSDYTHPDAAKQEFLTRIADVLGQKIVTNELKAFLTPGEQPIEAAANRRLHSTVGPQPFIADDYFWIKDRESLTQPPNLKLKAAIDKTKSVFLKTDLQHTTYDSAALVDEIRALRDVIRNTRNNADINAELLSYGEAKLAELCEKLTKRLDFSNTESKTFGDELLDIIEKDLINSASPEVTNTTESNFEDSRGWGSPSARITAADICYDLLNARHDLFPKIEKLIDRFLKDEHPAVRMMSSSNLSRLWNVDKDAMWSFGIQVCNSETNTGVLDAFTNQFLNRVVHTVPEVTEQLFIDIYNKAKALQKSKKSATEIVSNAATFLLLLSISHDRAKAKAIVDTFLDDPVSNKSLISKCIHSLRSGLTLGYGKDDIKENAIRIKCQAYAHQCAQVMSIHLKSIWDGRSDEPLNDDERSRFKVYAEILDTVCREYFFAAKPSDSQSEGEGVKAEYREAFLKDIEPTLTLIGDYGTPHSIYYLLQLLETLTPSQPIKVFELTSHALLNAGKKYGYQHEALGADLMVRMVGQLLADHREIFEDSRRRTLLIECLESFQNVGWPSARKLLYRLPELLQ